MRKILLLCFSCLMAFYAVAQDRVVSGKVTSPEDGSPIPGVNVVLKGTAIGTATDAEGKYTVSVPEAGGTLIFSFIGFKSQEIAVGDQATINVQMSADVTQLGEVVVTSFGIAKSQRTIGYAVTEVSKEKLVQISEPDAIRSLQGKVPGVNIIGSSGLPGSSTRITIRGNSSLTGQNQPLFVVDGIPYDNSFTGSATQSSLVGGSGYSNRGVDIDPSNIEDMTILKGASAAALYGTRAANGVVLIKTKSGSSRPAQKGLEMTFNSSFSVEKIANLPDYQNKYGAGANYNYSAANGSWGPAFGGQLQTIPHPYWGANFNAVFPELQGERVPFQAYPNNVKDFFNTGSVLENSLSISGGNDKSRITAVFSKINQEGMIPGTSFERTSVSVGGNSRLDNKFNIGANMSYTNSVQNGPTLGANNAVGGATIFARTLWLPRNFDLQGWPYKNPITNASLAAWLTGQIDNPIWSAENNKYISNVDRVTGYLSLGYDITDWLSANYKIGLNTYTDRRETTIRPGSVSAVGSGSGGVQVDNLWWQEIESNFILTATKSFSKDISLTANLGHNVNQRTSERQAFDGTQIVAFGIDDIDNVQNVIPAGGNYTRQRLFGVYGDVLVGYKNYLFLNIAARNDWASTLPQGSSFFYPSANASFVFTDAFNIGGNVLDYGKLRVGVGKVGNAPTPYNLAATYNINPGFGNVSQGLGVQFPFLGNAGALISTTIADPNLKPEFTHEIETGLEMRFLNSRVGFDLTLYKKWTTNQLGFVSLPAVTGYLSKYTNFGRVSNRGIELSMDVTPVKIGDFNWNIFTVFTKNISRVDELTEGLEQIAFGSAFTGQARAVHIPGYAFGVIEGRSVARDTLTGKTLIDRLTGYPIINAVTRKVIGDPNPDWTAGITNTFQYKGISLSFIFDIKYGGDIYSTTVQNMLQRGATTDTEDREKLVIIDGYYGSPTTFATIRDEDDNPIQNVTQVNVNNLYFGGLNIGDEYFVFDGTYVRLREITLGYQVPKVLLSKTPFGSARVSFSGRNLWLYTPNIPQGTNFDPETSTFGSTNQQGFEFTNAPTNRRYGVNISLTF